MYTDMANNEWTDRQLQFLVSPNPSVTVTTPKEDRAGLKPTATNHVVITEKFFVLNEQWQTCPPVVWLGYNRVPYTWQLNTDPGGYDNRVSDQRQQSAVTQRMDLHGLISRPNITTSMIYPIYDSAVDHVKWVTKNQDILELNRNDEQ